MLSSCLSTCKRKAWGRASFICGDLSALLARAAFLAASASLSFRSFVLAAVLAAKGSAR